jgi:uncharacterized protein
MADQQRRYILFYDYVEDVLDRRLPYRDVHLSNIRAAKEDGRILEAGPLGDPPHGAAIVFADQAAAEAFAKDDPYVQNGVATGWRVDTWTLV